MKQLFLAMVMAMTMLAGPAVASGATVPDGCDVIEATRIKTTRSGRILASCGEGTETAYVISRNGTMTALEDPWGYTRRALDINERGVVVGWSVDEDCDARGLVWIPPSYDVQVLEPLAYRGPEPGHIYCGSHSAAYSIDNRQRIIGSIQATPQTSTDDGVRDATWKVRGKSVVLLNVEDS